MGAHLEWIGWPRPALETARRAAGPTLDAAGGIDLPLRTGCRPRPGTTPRCEMTGDVISLDERRARESRKEPGRLSRIALQLAVLLACLAMMFGKIP